MFPPVLASALMIALLELAAARCFESLLTSGERSVGAGLYIEHNEPTPLGAHVVAHARWLGVQRQAAPLELIAAKARQAGSAAEYTRARSSSPIASWPERPSAHDPGRSHLQAG